MLVATDAAEEGINLQRAHLMINYDLPWNPNRVEQRFGRIHRIGQTEVCHLWNPVARGRTAFEQDELLQGWFVRNLQVIGEAARTLPDRGHSQKPVRGTVQGSEFHAAQKENAPDRPEQSA